MPKEILNFSKELRVLGASCGNKAKWPMGVNIMINFYLRLVTGDDKSNPQDVLMKNL